jgi:hypothetical protein
MRLLPPLLAVVLTACASPPSEPVASGPPPTEPPQVLGVQTWPSLPERTTTTTMPVVPATAAPPVTAHVHEVEPLAASEPVRAVGECGGWEGVVAQHFGDQATKACAVMACETGGTFSPTIENPRSTASGLFQFLDSTWRSARSLVGADQYARAKDAPGSVQIAAAAAWLRETSWSQWECA